MRFDLRRAPDCIVLVDPRVGGNVVFGADEIARHKERRPAARCLHRINECDLRKGTNEIDALLAEREPRRRPHGLHLRAGCATTTPSAGSTCSRPHPVIHNGADPAIFHPFGSATLDPGRPMRLVTHHWSDNPMKGFDVYQEVDRPDRGRRAPRTWSSG